MGIGCIGFRGTGCRVQGLGLGSRILWSVVLGDCVLRLRFGLSHGCGYGVWGAV